ncbi:MAG: hypothetical protein ACPGJI_01715 [Kangiellaceae bacterium]
MLTPPSISSAAITAGVNGDIEITIEHSDPEGDATNLLVEVSRDEGVTYKTLTLINNEPADLIGDSAGRTQIIWDSLSDLGFRIPTSAIIKITPSDASGSGEAFTFTTPLIDNIKVVAKNVDYHITYYGAVGDAETAILETYDLAVLHPTNGDLTRAQIADVQDGVDPEDPSDDVMVLCYISIGEDLRTFQMSDAEMLSDARFVGDGTGPRVDPREGAPFPNSGGSDFAYSETGDASPGGTGFASYYLDDNDYANDTLDLEGDGKGGSPDMNPSFQVRFTNIGDPAWFTVLKGMTFESDGVAGFDEILTTTTGRGLGCDGVFLDTLDTAAPNTYTNSDSFVQTESEWTAPGLNVLLGKLNEDHERALILQNRGLFYFTSQLQHYAFNARSAIDFLFFESYRLDSNVGEEINQGFFADNKYNFAPKIMAEANRSDGFTVVSLGYAEGPADTMNSDTLLGTNMTGFDSLITDIVETQDLAGFRHYLTDRHVTLLNEFVRDNSDLDDSTAPIWTSTYNDDFVWPPGEPTPRIGLQEVEAGVESVILRWDIAMDKHPVKYAVYYQTTPFDFAADDPLASATRVVVDPVAGDGYVNGVSATTFSNQATIEGLTAGDTYDFLIRAFDTSPAANEDSNEVTLSAVPLAL